MSIWRNLLRRGRDSRRRDFESHKRADTADEKGTTIRDIKRTEITPEVFTAPTKNTASYANGTKNTASFSNTTKN